MRRTSSVSKVTRQEEEECLYFDFDKMMDDFATIAADVSYILMVRSGGTTRASKKI